MEKFRHKNGTLFSKYKKLFCDEAKPSSPLYYMEKSEG